MKNIYEIFDEFEEAPTKEAKMAVLGNNLSKVLVDVLQLAFHPDYQWLITDMPENFTIRQENTIPGLSSVQLSTELRKLYLFQKGNIMAEKLTPEKRNQLLLQILESIEPREAEVVIGIFKKDLGVPGLDYAFVKEAFPKLLP